MAGRFQFSLKWLFALTALIALFVYCFIPEQKLRVHRIEIKIDALGYSPAMLDDLCHNAIVFVAKNHSEVTSVRSFSTRNRYESVVIFATYDTGGTGMVEDQIDNLIQDNVQYARSFRQGIPPGVIVKSIVDPETWNSHRFEKELYIVFKMHQPPKATIGDLHQMVLGKIMLQIAAAGPPASIDEAQETIRRLNEEVVGDYLRHDKIGELGVWRIEEQPSVIVSEWQR